MTKVLPSTVLRQGERKACPDGSTFAHRGEGPNCQDNGSGQAIQPVVDKLGVMQNQVFLLGRLCHVPTLYHVRSGRSKVAFRLAVPRSPATSHPRSSSRGDDPHVDYATVILLGPKARELHAQRLPRGAWVSVRGRLQTWSNGQWEIVAHYVEPAPMNVA